MKIKYLPFLALLAIYFLNITSAQAAPRDVICPSGYTAHFNGRILKCSKVIKEKSEYRRAGCAWDISGTVYHRQRGRDYCTRNSDGRRMKVVPQLVHDAHNYRRDVDASGQLDRFVKGGRNRTVYKYPSRR